MQMTGLSAQAIIFSVRSGECNFKPLNRDFSIFQLSLTDDGIFYDFLELSDLLDLSIEETKDWIMEQSIPTFSQRNGRVIIKLCDILNYLD